MSGFRLRSASEQVPPRDLKEGTWNLPSTAPKHSKLQVSARSRKRGLVDLLTFEDRLSFLDQAFRGQGMPCDGCRHECRYAEIGTRATAMTTAFRRLGEAATPVVRELKDWPEGQRDDWPGDQPRRPRPPGTRLCTHGRLTWLKGARNVDSRSANTEMMKRLR